MEKLSVGTYLKKQPTRAFACLDIVTNIERCFASRLWGLCFGKKQNPRAAAAGEVAALCYQVLFSLTSWTALKCKEPEMDYFERSVPQHLGVWHLTLKEVKTCHDSKKGRIDTRIKVLKRTTTQGLEGLPLAMGTWTSACKPGCPDTSPVSSSES